MTTAHTNLLAAALPSPMVVTVGLILLVAVLLSVAGKIPIGYNVRNLVVRWRTTVLTGLAFMLVISLQTVMLGFVAGMNKLTEESGQPGNVIVLSDGALDELVSNLGVTETADVGRHPQVLREGDEP